MDERGPGRPTALGASAWQYRDCRAGYSEPHASIGGFSSAKSAHSSGFDGLPFVRSAAQATKMDSSIALRRAHSASTVDWQGPNQLDSLTDHKSPFDTQPTPPKCTYRIATILVVSFFGLNDSPGAIRRRPDAWGLR